MDFYEPLLSDLLANRDGQRHRILFDYPAYDYAVPCQIVVEPERRAIAIVAYTKHCIPRYRMPDAIAIAAHSCRHDFPTVVVDEPTRRMLAIFPIAVQELESQLIVELALKTTVRRLLAVARRIDLCADGLSIETAAAISEIELLRGRVPLRRYRPFKRSD